nr:unknown [Halogeometricum pleomorphic virus 1]
EFVNCDLSEQSTYMSGFELVFNSLTGNSQADDCHWSTGDESTVKNLTQTDGYSRALGMSDAEDSYLTTTENFAQNTRSVAMSKAKITLINELNNGSSVSQANAAVNQTVRDYYSRIERDIADNWNQRALEASWLYNDVGMDMHSPKDGASTPPHYVGTENKTYTLQNGSTKTVRGIMYEYSPTGTNTNAGTLYMTDDTNVAYLGVEDPGSSGDTTFLSAGRTSALLSNIGNQSDYVVDNMDPYTDEVYAQYAAGEINSTDLAMMDPGVIGSEAATSFNSTGYYSHGAIMLASIGAGGNINVSHTVTTGDGTTLNGTLYYTAEDTPANGWENNVTYNTTNFNGTFYFAVQKDDGSGTIVDLANYGETFTITEATNTKTGEQVNTTQVQRYTYDSTNASQLQEEIDRLRELREEYESQLNSGGSGWGIGTEDKALIGVIAVAVILLVTRN